MKIENAKVDIDQQTEPIIRESNWEKPRGFFLWKKKTFQIRRLGFIYGILVHVCVCPIKIQGLQVF